MSGDVRRFLASGPDRNLTRFHLCVCARLNGIEQRGRTAFYTCLAADAAFALDLAARCDVTLQEIEIVGGRETYRVVSLGSHGLMWCSGKTTAPPEAAR